MHPVERLLNLVALLLETPRPLTFEEIRRRLHEGYGQDDLHTAKRMFERDKDVLRDLGIPVETVPTDPWEAEVGYRIPKDRYYLPEISFTPEELSALLVAARSATDDPLAEEAVRKLLAGARGGLGGFSAVPLVLDPGDGSRLSALADAIDRSRRVRFGYRTATGQASQREVDPYGLVWRAGHWYVVGLDHGRGELRAFRLSRIVSEVREAGEGSAPPEGFRAAEHVRAGPWGPGEPERHAVVAFSPEVAWWATAGIPEAERVRERPDGWVEFRVPLGAGDALASWVLGFGPDAEVRSPRSLRDEVIRRLEAARGA
ncbi:MAG TPA: WYL domain-containing protein [Actinomycetota bacterium]|nr:WYL domain-containing protein [Actinomycetota bacterium]